MLQEVKISTFLKTGMFGQVCYGDSIGKVLSYLGEPDGELILNKPFFGIYFSGYEFIFKEKKLTAVQNDKVDTDFPENTHFENKKIIISPEILKADKSYNYSAVINYLKLNQIEFKQMLYFERNVILTEGGVVIDFDNEFWDDNLEETKKYSDRNNYLLIGIRYHPSSGYVDIK